MKKPIFTGSNVAIITPFKDKRVNFEELGKLIDFHLNNSTDSITICGTTGESAALTDEEHRECIRYCVERVNGRIPVIAGTGSNDTNYAVSLSQYACGAGVDGILLVTPYYNKTSQTGLVKHFTYIADRVTKPMILYNVPSRTGMCFTAQTYYELSKHPMINGIKEASGNFSLIAETRALCGDDMNIWSGNDDQIVPILALGGKGVISVLANIMPKETHDMVALYFEGKVKESCDLQIKLYELISALFTEVNPMPVKAAAKLMGFNPGELRMPLCDISEKNLEILKKAMINAGIPIKA
ncbi:MAG: 4-hydroxy-tetrahydrodipicolinate synthase [Bacillota bacterium]|nr:4-hydroxy-tetrahydrodipicolinate synthase [Bacillota bacterium]